MGSNKKKDLLSIIKYYASTFILYVSFFVNFLCVKFFSNTTTLNDQILFETRNKNVIYKKRTYIYMIDTNF